MYLSKHNDGMKMQFVKVMLAKLIVSVLFAIRGEGCRVLSIFGVTGRGDYLAKLSR